MPSPLNNSNSNGTSHTGYHQDPKTILCPYYLHGVCRFGTSCRYSHDIKHARQDDVCRYYQLGACSYGSRCRYRHVKLNKPEPKPDIGLGLPKSFESSQADTLPANTAMANGSSRELNASSTGSDNRSDSVAAVEAADDNSTSFAELLKRRLTLNPRRVICPFYQKSGTCSNPHCCDVHGQYCHACEEFALDPEDNEQRSKHQHECNALFEQRMEEAFAINRSLDKVCSICLDTVIDKPNKSEARFGLLQNCEHVFCLPCIRKWRASGNEHLKNEIVKACPECRVTSDFVTPSAFWYEDLAHKQRIIDGYRKRIAEIDCSYFKRGEGHCPFADRCFYRHQYPDGTNAKLGSPRRLRGIIADGSVVTNTLATLYGYILRDRSTRNRLSSRINDTTSSSTSSSLSGSDDVEYDYETLVDMFLERELATFDFDQSF